MPAKYPEALSLNKVDLIVSLGMGCRVTLTDQSSVFKDQNNQGILSDV